MEHQQLTKAKPEHQQQKKQQPSAQLASPAGGSVSPLLHLQRHLGNEAFGRFIQAKLTVNQPGDIYEQEADRVAEQVMRMPNSEVSGISNGVTGIQRTCTACASGQGLCPQCAEEERLQRKPLAATITPMVQRDMPTTALECPHDWNALQTVLSWIRPHFENFIYEHYRAESGWPAHIENEVIWSRPPWNDLNMDIIVTTGTRIRKQLKLIVDVHPQRSFVEARLYDWLGSIRVEIQRWAGFFELFSDSNGVGCRIREISSTPQPRHRMEPEQPIQTKELSGWNPGITPNLESQILSMQGGGQPLPESARAFFEPRFGHDFSQVHVHTDAQAGQIARDVHARAFTIGRDIVFATGEYAPESTAGRQLLAHELTHVIQQRSNVDSIQRTPVNPLWGPFEIRGDDDFIRTVRYQLDQLNATSNGHDLIQELVRNRSGMWYSTISIQQENVNFFLPRGIFYNPHYVIGNACGTVGYPNWPNVPPYVNLHHEIVHAYIYHVMGEGSNDDRECMATGLGRYFTEIPYNENRLRCELGRPIRPCYDGECSNFPPGDCNELAVYDAQLRERQEAESHARQVEEVSTILGLRGGRFFDRPGGQPSEEELQRANEEARRRTDYIGPDIRIEEVWFEASSMLERIQRKPLVTTITPMVQRKSGLAEAESLHNKENAGNVPQFTPQIAADINVLRGGGQPLSQLDRAFFEPRFGVDFSGVRVHTDTRAADTTRAMNAKAFTLGKDVVFGAGQYAPDTKSGRQLIAHELTHVLQQQSAVTARSGKSGDRWQQQAKGSDAMITDNRAVRQIAPIPGAPRIQRRSLPRFLGTQLARLIIRIGSTTTESDILAGEEVVPLGERPGRFEGFTNQYIALVTARQHPTATVIILDTENRYHVFDLGLPTMSSDAVSIVPYEEQGYQFVRWMNLVTMQQPTRSWRERVGEANSLYSAYRDASGSERERRRQAAEEAFVVLIAESLGIQTSEIRIIRSVSEKQPNVINFDLDLGPVAEGGIGTLPTSRTDTIPEPTITLGPSAVSEESPIATQLTLVHEATHETHAQRSIELLEQWRRSNDRRGFETWLEEQFRRRRISPIDYRLTLERTRGGIHVTQTLATLEGFMAGYHLRSVNESEISLFKQLSDMAAAWPFAGHEIQNRTVEQLHRFYCQTMDEPHRQAFNQFVARKLHEAEQAPVSSEEIRNSQHLYRRLVAFATQRCQSSMQADILRQLQRSYSNSYEGRVIEAKLTVNQSGDIYEQEADRVAEQVMHMKAASFQKHLFELPAGGTAIIHRQPNVGVESTEASALNSFHHKLGPGQPLDASTREFMESRFGYDFSQVRIHTDAQTAEAASAVKARAFTLGSDIVFGEGQYAPETSEGKRLLAHELTHVVQQGIFKQVQNSLEQHIIFRNVRFTAGGEGEILEQAWWEQVREARMREPHHERELELINVALSPVYGAYTGELRFPVRMFDLNSVAPGGVYFDPTHDKPGTTFLAQDPPERRGSPIQLERLYGDQPAPPPPRITSGGNISMDIQSDPNLIYSFIKLGPLALSEGTRAWTRSILYHEYLHYQSNMSYIRRGWPGIRDLASMTSQEEATEHALIHARTFRLFFPHLEWHGTLHGRGDPVWRLPQDPALASLQPAAEAINDLGVLQRDYFPQASSSGRDEVIQEILGIISDNPEAGGRLREIVEAMPPDLVHVPPESRLQSRLLDALPPVTSPEEQSRRRRHRGRRR